MRRGYEAYSPSHVTENVIVIGAGIAGLSVALELGKRGVPVTVFEQGTIGQRVAERSEVTHPEETSYAGALSAVTNPLSSSYFYVPESNLRLQHRLPRDDDPLRNPIIAIDHELFLRALEKQIRETPLVQIEENAQVTEISEDDQGPALKINYGSRIKPKTIVNAAGPWLSLPFADPTRQKQYETGIVGFTYGRRYHGIINVEDGDRTLLSSLSRDGSGRSSWVIASPEEGGTLDVAYNDYAQRKDAIRLIPHAREIGFPKLIENLQKAGLISITGKAGPRIGGIFGLEPRRSPSGNTNVFHHGERGGYASASVGDSIAPTIRMSQTLAEIIARGGTADEYYKATSTTFSHLWETATLRTRLRAETLGRGTQAILKAFETMSLDEQKNYLRDHNFPKPLWKSLPRAILHYPPIIRIMIDQAVELAKEMFRGDEVDLNPQLARSGVIFSRG